MVHSRQLTKLQGSVLQYGAKLHPGLKNGVGTARGKSRVELHRLTSFKPVSPPCLPLLGCATGFPGKRRATPPPNQKEAGKKAQMTTYLLVIGEYVGNHILQGCKQNSHQERTDTWETQKESQERLVLQNVAKLLTGDLHHLPGNLRMQLGSRSRTCSPSYVGS
ncbi:hypothetical protein LEMLEM_LOCUS26645 [Lemmus lemmus]